MMTPAPTAPVFDPALIARYDTHGPRYTSYPTALQFRDDFTAADLRAAIRASNEEPIPRPLSLYVHVPFCRSPCFYCGCNRVITRDPDRADRYLDRLLEEIALLAPLFDRDRGVRQLHLGGGTPNFFDLVRMQRLMDALERGFSLDPGDACEAGIELDPRFVAPGYLTGLAALGFNRLSLGIQDFDLAVQRAINRVQGVAITAAVLEEARTAGFGSISVDLIYGLPRQTLAGFGRSLDQVIALAPDRIAVYAYAHLPAMFKAQRQIRADELPDPATRLALSGLALEKLCAAGYVYIGMDHFARIDDALAQAQRAGNLQRNFQGYSTHGDCDIVGLGVSAIGRIGDCYSQNERDVAAYENALDKGGLPVARGLLLQPDDLLRREAISELMCHGRLDMQAFGQRHGIDFGRCFSDALGRLQPLAADRLVSVDERSIRVTARGRLLLRHVAMCFDAYLAQSPAGRYSRAI